MDLTERSVYRGQITKLAKSAQEYLSSSDSKIDGDNEKQCEIEEELSSYIQRITVARDCLNRINAELKPSIKAEAAQKEFEAICDYQDKATAILARLDHRLKSMKSNVSNPAFRSENERPIVPSCAKLPKLALKVFSGDSKDWISFWEHFRAAVHDRDDISGADKFNYLSSHVSGRAAECIAGFTPTGANYDAAVSLLLEQFGNEEKIINDIMQQLMNLPKVVYRGDTVNLRKLHNCVVTNTRSLTMLNVPSTRYSIMLKPLLLRCLPREMVLEFQRQQSTGKTEKVSETSDDENASISACSNASSISAIGCDQLKAVILFLKRELSSLESAEFLLEKKARTQTSGNIKSYKTAAGLLTPSKEAECYFCKTVMHTTEMCNSDLTIPEKKAILKRNGCCFKCTRKGHSAKRCFNKHLKCQSCGGKHATSVCDPTFRTHRANLPIVNHMSRNSKSDTATVLCSSTQTSLATGVLLQTARAIALSKNNSKSILIRIILDGGSQRTYIKRSVAVMLGLQAYDTVSMQILPFGSSGKSTESKVFERVQIRLQSAITGERIEMLAIVVPNICPDILQSPKTVVPSILPELALADDDNIGEIQNEIGMLLGADIYWAIISDEFKRINDRLVAINTIFGWTLQGPVPLQEQEMTSAVNLTISQLNDDMDSTDFVVKHIEDLWQFDRIPSSPDNQCDVDELISKHVRKKDQRYEASLLWKNEDCVVEDNRRTAMIRLVKLISRLEKEPQKLKQYSDLIDEWIDSGIAEVCKDDSYDPKTYYMPHRPVYREDKETTKTRIVFDASSQASSQAALNDMLCTGPNLLPDVLAVLLNFRLGSFAMTADIEKAFLQVELNPKDRNSHRFLWLKNLADIHSVITLVMTRVTFGVRCSPFLLCAVLRKHLKCSAQEFPKTVELLLSCFYVDDLVVSVDDYEDALQLYFETCEILGRISMNVRKWKSNVVQIRRIFREEATLLMKQKVLGVIWQTEADELSVDLSRILGLRSHNLTKRILLQTIAAIYDPLGILTPYVTKLKLLFQETWRQKLRWDEPLPSIMIAEFNKHVADLDSLTDFTLPRCVFNQQNRSTEEIHIFADACPKAYGAMAFIRSVYRDGSISTEFLCSKGRIAPIRSKDSREVTLPKMELAAALVAAKLADYLNNNLKLSRQQRYFWTDSKIVLYWIRNSSSKRNAYVDNKVKEIRHLTEVGSWKHCPGSDNPADLLTRGVSAKILLNSNSWRHGPDWLSADETEWPTQDEELAQPKIECSLLTSSNIQSALSEEHAIMDIGSFSQYRKVIRTTAYVFRFIDKLKGNKSGNKYLTANELHKAELYWIKVIQHNAFKEEVTAVSGKNSCPKHSKILSLNPFLDEDEVLRVGSRLNESGIGFNEKFPIILPNKSRFTVLLISYMHERVLHSGTSIVLVQLRKRFWIIKARQAIKTIVSKCSVCKRLKGKAAVQPFAPLPKERLQLSRPFETVGIDFAGPLYVRIASEGSTTRKVYILLITCAVVRAVHLELVLDLKTESCILALRRFCSRRGVPSLILSDNAKTFKRAALEFRELQIVIQSEDFQNYLSNNNIAWKFSVERAPWWGGFWERLVKITKDLLKVSIQRATVSFDQLSTYLAEVEYIINVRPLTYVSSDCNDLSPLTPANFLFGTFPSGVTTLTHTTGSDIRAKWQSRFRFANYFFKRFKTEYVQSLRSAHHTATAFSRQLEIGDVVLVHDASTPRLFWKLARITKTFPGRDNRVRACEVQLGNGIVLKRPIQHLFPLEIN